MRILELEIKNFKKHNPRSDSKSCSWFRMSNDFFTDPEFFMVSGDGQRLWFYLLGQASKKMSDTIKINTQLVANTLRIDVGAVDFAILELIKTGSLNQKPVTLVSDELPAEHLENVTLESCTLRTNERNERNVTNERNEDSIAEKNLPEIKPQDFRNSKEIILAGLKNPDELIQLWDQTLGPIGFPSAPIQLSGSGAQKFFLMNKLLHQNGKTWQEYIERIKASEFLTRKKRGGPPALTWLFVENNFDDVFSGKYDDRKNPHTSPSNQTGNPYLAELIKRGEEPA